MKVQLTRLILLSATIHAACLDPAKSTKTKHSHKPPTKHLQKRNAKNEPLTDPRYGPSPIKIDLPAEFLPPPCGRSQIIENEPSKWRACPKRHLDCIKCPQDFQCQRPEMPSWEQAYMVKNGVAQLSGSPEDDGQAICPLAKCDGRGARRYGANVRCTREYCVCNVDRKGSWRRGAGYRGTDELGAVTVYVSSDADCDTPCVSMSCREVEQLKRGLCWEGVGVSRLFWNI
ncbi:hypothetical protein GQ44DRAFT_736222 [Phaeosphaeriaceae sp. PMI808]|nr:hypothetical protein GQ44DRAFT_736222 [Phaeosphaeriaceae sp. PMI808]